MTYGHKHGWAVLAVFILSGALIRQYFVLRHAGKNVVALPAVATVLLLAVAILIAPRSGPAGGAAATKAVAFAEVQPIIRARCGVCHAAQPTFPGFQQPPGGLTLDTAEQIAAAAPRIHQQTIATQAMPIGNLTKMTDEERQVLGKWLAQGARTN
jgi:uncharacterized membrane protein